MNLREKATGINPKTSFRNISQQAAGYYALRFAGLFNLSIPLRCAFVIGVSRTKLNIIIFSVLLIFFTSISFAVPQNNQSAEDVILSAAENLFVYMKNKEYVSVWNCLSVKSKKAIIDSVYSESKKAGVEYKKNELLNDFNFGGILAKTYWDNFLDVFDPNIALEQCKWEMGKIEKTEAEVILKYKKSDKPAILKMYKENSEWKVGLEESFGARKLNPF